MAPLSHDGSGLGVERLVSPFPCLSKDSFNLLEHPHQAVLGIKRPRESKFGFHVFNVTAKSRWPLVNRKVQAATHSVKELSSHVSKIWSDAKTIRKERVVCSHVEPLMELARVVDVLNRMREEVEAPRITCLITAVKFGKYQISVEFVTNLVSVVTALQELTHPQATLSVFLEGVDELLYSLRSSCPITNRCEVAVIAV